jgi:hypothetical protein
VSQRLPKRSRPAVPETVQTADEINALFEMAARIRRGGSPN